MENLIIRTQSEMASAVEGIVRGIMDGLEAAGDAGEYALPPDDLVISGVFMVEANADTEDDTASTPETVLASSEVQPAVVTTVEDTNSGATTNESYVPPAQTEIRSESGGDRNVTYNDYEEV